MAMSQSNQPSADMDSIFEHFGDLFGDIFGGRPRTSGGVARDLVLDLPVTLEEAVEGAERRVPVGRFFVCDECRGRSGSRRVG